MTHVDLVQSVMAEIDEHHPRLKAHQSQGDEREIEITYRANHVGERVRYVGRIMMERGHLESQIVFFSACGVKVYDLNDPAVFDKLHKDISKQRKFVKRKWKN
jgi:hypothetical protein